MNNIKDETVFYSMVSLLKTAEYYGNYLIDSKAVSHSSKNEIRNMTNHISRFVKIVAEGLPENARQQWLEQWKNKDYFSLTNIIEYAANLNDDKRNQIEEYAKQLSEN